MSILSTLHYTLIEHILREGYAPDVEPLADLLGMSSDATQAALYELQEYHGVVLHPHAPKVWAIHPFSLAPTPFTVSSPTHTWWGNCAWCSLGIAALVGEDVEIKSTLGAMGAPVTVHIRDKEVIEQDLLIHFPIPMTQAWDNVVYTCSTMLFFAQEAAIDLWCQERNIPKGDVQRLGDFWPFAQEWYGRHADPDWQKWTATEAQAMFEKHGLTHAVWQLPGSGDRF